MRHVSQAGLDIIAFTLCLSDASICQSTAHADERSVYGKIVITVFVHRAKLKIYVTFHVRTVS